MRLIPNFKTLIKSKEFKRPTRAWETIFIP